MPSLPIDWLLARPTFSTERTVEDRLYKTFVSNIFRSYHYEASPLHKACLLHLVLRHFIAYATQLLLVTFCLSQPDIVCNLAVAATGVFNLGELQTY